MVSKEIYLKNLKYIEDIDDLLKPGDLISIEYLTTQDPYKYVYQELSECVEKCYNCTGYCLYCIDERKFFSKYTGICLTDDIKKINIHSSTIINKVTEV